MSMEYKEQRDPWTKADLADRPTPKQIKKRQRIGLPGVKMVDSRSMSTEESLAAAQDPLTPGNPTSNQRETLPPIQEVQKRRVERL